MRLVFWGKLTSSPLQYRIQQHVVHSTHNVLTRFTKLLLAVYTRYATYDRWAVTTTSDWAFPPKPPSTKSKLHIVPLPSSFTPTRTGVFIHNGDTAHTIVPSNPQGGEPAKKQFHDLNEAYEVQPSLRCTALNHPPPQCLKDPTRRSAYDALRNVDLAGIYGARGTDDDEDEVLRRARSFEEAFGRSWREAYGASHSREHWRRRARERTGEGYWEEYRANMEAWEAEKREAVHIKVDLLCAVWVVLGAHQGVVYASSSLHTKNARDRCRLHDRRDLSGSVSALSTRGTSALRGC